MATEEIQISELELADSLLEDMLFPVESATDTNAATLLQLKKWLGSSLPTGFILPAIGRIDDARFTLLDGKTLSRTGTYSEFCNKVIEQVQLGNWFACSQSEYDEDLSSKGQCGRFVIEDDYVRIPTITRYIGATVTLLEFGQAFNESLPNISGTMSVGGTEGKTSDMSGALYEKGTVTSTLSGSYTGNRARPVIGFNSSLSSSTYQDGAKVNVEHVKYPYYMVISTEGQTTPISVDINKVYEDLELKANKDLSNAPLNIDYVVESYGPDEDGDWYRIYRNGWIEQGGRILAQTAGNIRVNLLKEMANTNYNIIGSITTLNSQTTVMNVPREYSMENGERTTTTFQTYILPSQFYSFKTWEAKGQGA